MHRIGQKEYWTHRRLVRGLYKIPYYVWEKPLRNRRLDILRAVAVLLVLGRHAEGGPLLWKQIGWVGVDLFFVLSGFLISGLLYTEYKKTGAIHWKRFFIRRGFKIYPAFYVMILVSILWPLALRQKLDWHSFLPEVLFFQNYSTISYWNHTWSLAVEEHFYIFLPILLLALIRWQRNRLPENPFRAIPAICLFLSLACLLQRVYLAWSAADLKTSWPFILFPSHLRIDSLFFGVFIGYQHHFHPVVLHRITSNWRARLLLLGASAALLSLCFVFPVISHFMLSFGLTALYLGFGGVLILSLYTHGGNTPEQPLTWRRFLPGDLAAFVGKYSYSIYLWHVMVTLHYKGFLNLIWPGIGLSGLFYGYVVLSIAGGILLSLAIEYPVLELRDRLFPDFQSVHSLSSKPTLAPAGTAE